MDSILAPLGKVTDYTQRNVTVQRNAKLCMDTSSSWLSDRAWHIEYSRVGVSCVDLPLCVFAETDSSLGTECVPSLVSVQHV